MSYSVQAGDVIVCAGDSKTVGGVASANGPSKSWALNLKWGLDGVLQAKGNAPTVSLTTSGVVGATSANLVTNINAWVIAFSPTLCFLMCWVNDARGSVPPATTAANLNTAVTAIWAALPTCRIVVMGCDYDGVLIHDGDNPHDALLDATNARLVTEVATLSASGSIVYVDTRNAWWFPAIAIANPGNSPTNSVLSTDTLHDSQAGALSESTYIASQATATTGPGIATTPPLTGVGTVASPIGLANATALNPGAVTATNAAKIAALFRPKNGADLTDADQTLNPFADKASQYVQPAATPLTANRTKLLDPTGGFYGLTVRVVREDTANFTLTVSNSGTGGASAGTFTFAAAPTVVQAAIFQHNGTDYNFVDAEYDTGS